MLFPVMLDVLTIENRAYPLLGDVPDTKYAENGSSLYYPNRNQTWRDTDCALCQFRLRVGLN